jgi:hypothetical protein
MTNLVNVGRDEVRISEIVKALDGKPEKGYIITNDWNEVEEQLNQKFGTNNPRTPHAECVEEMEDVIENLVHKQRGTISIQTSTTSAAPLCNATPPSGRPTVLCNKDYNLVVWNCSVALVLLTSRRGHARRSHCNQGFCLWRHFSAQFPDDLCVSLVPYVPWCS